MTNEELRPMTIGQLLDKTFRLSLKCVIKHILTHLLFGGVMFGVMVASVIVMALLAAGPMMVSTSSNYEAFFVIAMLAIMALTIPLSIIWYGLLFDMQIKGYLNERWRLKSSFKPILKKFWVIVAAGLLSIPIMVLGYVALVVGVIGALALLCSVMPVIIYEGQGPVNSIKRSFKLTGYSFWRVTGQMAVFILITFGFLFLLNAARVVPAYLLSSMQNQSLLSAGLYLVIASFTLLYMAFSIFAYILGVTFYTLLYFNQRIKYENFGMEMMAEEMINEINNGTDGTGSEMFDEKSRINNSNTEGDHYV